MPRILGDVNTFVAGPADGDLDAWATQVDHPTDAVQTLATEIHEHGRRAVPEPRAGHWQGRERTEPRKNVWMFLRWLVRPAPDLHRGAHLDPADLLVPTDRHVAGFALAAGIINSLPSLGPRCAHAERITAWAARHWPGDPARRLRLLPVGPRPIQPASAHTGHLLRHAQARRPPLPRLSRTPEPRGEER